MVAGCAAFARNLGPYPHSGNIMQALQAECARYKTSKSGIRFTPGHRFPPPLVGRTVASRQGGIAGG